MRAAMCFTHFQLPRCQIHTLCGSWWKKVNTLTKSQEKIATFRLLGPDIYGLQGGNGNGNNGRWTRKSVSTNAEGKNMLSRKTTSISQQITDVSSLTHSSLNTGRVEIGECKSVYIEPKICENKDVSKSVTVIVFDIETTGFKRDADRIIEIALRDLSGGVDSTFQTLVNPDMLVMNSDIHGISSSMVKSTAVPRMIELIPILLQYVRSRQKPGGQTLFVAHNAKTFDVPFLMNEFKRCSYEIPSDWHFMDSMSPARELKNLKIPEGQSVSRNHFQNTRPNTPTPYVSICTQLAANDGLMICSGMTRVSRSLQALREHYKIPLTGNAHRAMADANVLALVLQKMTRDLKLTIPCLLDNYSFTASDIINNNNAKKKNSR